ncbi:MAG: M55 family metallopeptidase [Candidatus Marinimicrobia bacterium]|nr:M55 family metallopeptidase [Candidatus Neomarinimicrobiota bacterium]
MKIYISVDMEGITGVNHWDEVTKDKSEYSDAQAQMTAEVAAACRGAFKAGAKEIVIKDAHDTGRNILASGLPENTKLIRGWSGHPLGMVQEIDKSFDAVMMIGYHSRAYGDGNPLAHTWSSSAIAAVSINGKFVSEYAMHMMAAEYYGVPTVLVSGDQGLADEIHDWNSHVKTVVTKEGIGNSTVNIHPETAINMIESEAEKVLSEPFERCHNPLSDSFNIEIRFKTHMKAYRAGHYPGAYKVDAHTIGFKSDDYYEIMRFTFFAF